MREADLPVVASRRHGVAAGPSVVKPNADELRDLSGHADPLGGAQELRRQGAHSVVVSLGAEGMLAVTPETAWRAAPVRPVRGNPTGAGDAAVAALALGLNSDSPWPERVVDAVALSAAAVAAPLAGDVDPVNYEGCPVRLKEIHAPGIHR